MGYRFDCDPVLVGAVGHEMLQALSWATWIPDPQRDGKEWSYCVSGTKHPERPVPILLAVAYLVEGREAWCEIRGEEEDDVRTVEVCDGMLQGFEVCQRVTWRWLATSIRNMRRNSSWDPRCGPLAQDNQSNYAGYGVYSGAELLDALRPALMRHMITGQTGPLYGGPGAESTAMQAAERFGLWGRSVEENQANLQRAASLLRSKGIAIPATLGRLMSGWARHPNGW